MAAGGVACAREPGGVCVGEGNNPFTAEAELRKIIEIRTRALAAQEKQVALLQDRIKKLELAQKALLSKINAIGRRAVVAAPSRCCCGDLFARSGGRRS